MRARRMMGKRSMSCIKLPIKPCTMPNAAEKIATVRRRSACKTSRIAILRYDGMLTTARQKGIPMLISHYPYLDTSLRTSAGQNLSAHSIRFYSQRERFQGSAPFSLLILTDGSKQNINCKWLLPQQRYAAFVRLAAAYVQGIVASKMGRQTFHVDRREGCFQNR